MCSLPSSLRSRARRAAARLALVAGILAFASPSQAASILFARVSDVSYVADGNQLAAMLSAAGHSVTVRNLDSAIYSDYSSFEQIFVYDLSYAADTSATQMANYAAIAGWYNGLTNKNLILDGRIISSAPGWTAANSMSPEDAWIQNYATQLGLRGGGLVLGTDHNDYHSGINEINAAIGVTGFTGFYGSYPTSQAVVDSGSPLYLPTLDPCRANAATRCVNDNSTTGFAPTGLQANGQTLTPVVYHGDNLNAWDFAAVSATMGSPTFNTCGGPNQPPCTVPVPEPATLALVGLGLAAVGAARRRAQRKS